MSIKEKLKNSKLAEFWLKYNEKIILAAGIILIAAVSFEAGLLHGQKNKQESVLVNKTACAPCPKSEITDKNNAATTGTSIPQNNPITTQTTKQPATEPQNCPFVASKNSNKYHLASCQWAAKIKPENKICFPTAEEAISRGYLGAKCCIK